MLIAGEQFIFLRLRSDCEIAAADDFASVTHKKKEKNVIFERKQGHNE